MVITLALHNWIIIINMGVRGELNTCWFYLTLPFIIFTGYFIAYAWKLPFVEVWVIFGLIPRIDELISQDWLNPTLEEIMALENSAKFKIVLYLSLLADWGALVAASYTIWSVDWVDVVPLVFLMALLSSISFLVAHELFHKDNICDKFFGTLWI
jgi:hypothetical protein